MTSGFSPKGVARLVDLSTRVYINFTDEIGNSNGQVESFVREVQIFAQSLLELEELMRDFGRQLPFPVEDFERTLSNCEAKLRSYKEGTVAWKVTFVGKVSELANLRKEITGNCRTLHICIHFLQLRSGLEASRREQRLLLEPHDRMTSHGVHLYATGELFTSTQASCSTLPQSKDVLSLYNAWERFSQWLKVEDEQADLNSQIVRPSSWDDTPRVPQTEDSEISSVLYRLRCEVEDALVFEGQNRAKQAANQRQTHLSLRPSDAIKRQVQETLAAPHPRIYAFETRPPDPLERVDITTSSNNSEATYKPTHSTPSIQWPSPETPQFGQRQSTLDDRDQPLSSLSLSSVAALSVPADRDSFSSRNNPQPSSKSQTIIPHSGIGASGVITDEALSNMIRSILSSASLTTTQWSKLCHKVQVVRRRLHQEKKQIVPELNECDLQWSYRQDGGISLRAVYRSKRDGRVRSWTQQDFPALGPPIPLTTTIDGVTTINFPRGSFGKLNNQCTDIKYIFASSEASTIFQTLLYTNNGYNPADLLFDRPIRAISSDKNRPECRGRNLRLWRRTEMHQSTVDVLVLLFYTSALEERGHWVEEPHYAFEWLPETTKRSDRVTLVYSKNPGRWVSDKLFQQEESPQASALSSRRVFEEISSRLGTLNSFGYTRLEIEFQGKHDCKDFLDVWRNYVKPIGSASRSKPVLQAPVRRDIEPTLPLRASLSNTVVRGNLPRIALEFDRHTVASSGPSETVRVALKTGDLSTPSESARSSSITNNESSSRPPSTDAPEAVNSSGSNASLELLEPISTMQPNSAPLPLSDHATHTAIRGDSTSSPRTNVPEVTTQWNFTAFKFWREALTCFGLMEPACPTGKRRIRWQCKCGTRGYSDVTELAPGGIFHLKDDMKRFAGVKFVPTGNVWENVRSSRLIQDTVEHLRKFVGAGGVKPTNIPALPQHNVQPVSVIQKPQPGPTQYQSVHIMACMHQNRYGKSVNQEKIDGVSTDRELFVLLKQQYRRRRGIFISRLSMRAIQGILFVKFRLSLGGSVEVRYHEPCCNSRPCECLPPEAMVEPSPQAQYRCKPGPPEVYPPILPDYLLHLFTSPSCIDVNETWVLDQLPKRTCGQLYGAPRQPAEGWGILYEEGWDIRKIAWVYLIFGVLGSFLFGVLWSLFQRDVQGAFGVSAWWITVGTSVLALLAIALQSES